MIILDRTLAPKTDRLRGKGSNPLVKLIRGWIGSDGLISLADPIRPGRYRPKLYKLPTRFAEVKPASPKLYKPPTRFAAVKRASSILYKSPTRFAEVKTDLSGLL